MQASIPNRMLVSFDGSVGDTPGADYEEIVSNSCLFFLRTALGSSYRTISSNGTTTVQIHKAHSAALRALAGLMAFTLWLPITLIGIAVWACSRTHSLQFAMVKQLFQLRIAGNNPKQLATLFNSEIAPQQHSGQFSCMRAFTQEQLIILTQELLRQNSPETTFETLILAVAGEKYTCLEAHIKRVASILSTMGISDPLAWVDNRKNKDAFYRTLGYIALSQILQVVERPLLRNHDANLDRNMRMHEIATNFDIWHKATHKITAVRDYLTDNGRRIAAVRSLYLIIELSTPRKFFSQLLSSKRIEHVLLILEGFLLSQLHALPRIRHFKSKLQWLRVFVKSLRQQSEEHNKVHECRSCLHLSERIIPKATSAAKNFQVATLNPLFPFVKDFLLDVMNSPLKHQLTTPYFATIISLGIASIREYESCQGGILLKEVLEKLDRSKNEDLQVIRSAIDAALTACIPLKSNANPILNELNDYDTLIDERRVLLEQTVRETLKESLIPDCTNIVLDYFMTVPTAAPKDAMGLHAFNL